MKRALMVAATLLAAGGGVDAQSNREQFIYWWDWQDGTFWSRTERWVPPVGNPEAVRCVLQNRQTGLTWDGIAYLTGSAPPPARVDTVTVIVTDTIVVRDTVYLPADTIAEPIPTDTVSLPPDTTIVGRLAARWEPHTWGADVIVQLADSAAGVDVTFSPSGGFMGPPTAPVTGEWTRQTSATGQVGVGWRSYSVTDTMTIRSGRDTLRIGVPVDTTTLPVPIPPVTVPPVLPPTGGASITPLDLLIPLGPLAPAGTVSDAQVQRLDARFDQHEPGVWQYYADRETDINIVIVSHHYGALRGRLQWSIRNGEAIGPQATEASSAYARGRRIVRAFLARYSKPNKFYIPAYWNTGLLDVEALYVLEGDPDALTHIWVTGMASTYDPNGYYKGTNSNTELRPGIVGLQAYSFLHRNGVPFQRSSANSSIGFDSSPGSWLEAGRRQIGWFDAWCTTGVCLSPGHGGDEVYFYNAWLATELLNWWAFVEGTQRPQAYELAVRLMDHLVDEWQRRGGSLPYQSTGYATGGNTDLAAFHVWPALVLWQETGDAKYYDFAMAHLAAANTANSVYLVKQFNQITSTLAQGAEALLQGVAWR
jgi:hypothetical protein